MAQVYTIRQLADYVEGEVHGDASVQISALNGFELAGPGEISFLQDSRKCDQLSACRAEACIVPQGTPPQAIPTIAVRRPDIAAARIHQLLLAEPYQAKGVHGSAVMGSDCQLPEAVTIGALVCLGDRVRLGEGVTIHPGVVIGDDVTIGDDSVLHANVTVAEKSRIGRRVTIYQGAVIGSAGFGFASDEQGTHYTKPQVGTVRIDDDVEIGANSCVDRAAFGTTWIKSGVRIDNLVQVAHNVVIGENSVLVSQTGIAGSTTLGRSVVLGAKAGVTGHVHLDDGVMVAAMGGVHNSQPKGAMIGGIPAIDVKKWGRAAAALTRLPEMLKEVRRLRKEIDRLRGLVKRDEE
ncbi:UDP-3-O-(3-hydroxymyristoyl)glucosamine N-acyltransferase [Desulfogranum mediterraneum]|uniref:UDP-3-O-(3-hydroxymyristoyl)glucosamine N-acyltransferase n=1 Tax=Desulfogranum mediterraneum TaxID=160661 RepID=UPI00048DCC04|nr:UDP-3-O-(3-hydroxymyristoyl)glucosamine N-acyltransferase [Desulfogranum mediterraneum]